MVWQYVASIGSGIVSLGEEYFGAEQAEERQEMAEEEALRYRQMLEKEMAAEENQLDPQMLMVVGGFGIVALIGAMYLLR
ncbi:MAG: hypothetical protein ACOCRX_03245 [Candidatus Woesearchaeota archaeon]